MAENEQQNVNEADLINDIFNSNKSTEDVNKILGVTNNDTTETVEDTAEKTTTETTEATTTEEGKTATTTDEPFYKKRGFNSEAEMDSLIDAAKKPKEPTYSNPISKELDNFTKATGKTDFESFQFYKTAKLGAEGEPLTTDQRIELMVQKDLLDNPVLSRFKKEELIEQYKKDYMLDMDPDHAPLNEKIAAAKKEAELITVSNKVIEDIKEIQGKIANGGVSEKDQAEHAAKVEANKTQWNQESTKAANDYKLEIKDFETNDNGEDKFLENVLKSYTFGQDVKDSFKTSYDSVIAQMGYPEPNSDSAKLAWELADMATTKLFLHRIVKEAIAQAKAEVTKEDVIERDNPSKNKVPAKVDDPTKVISEAQAVKEALG